MTTRSDLITKHAAEAVERILEATATNGGRPWLRIVEDEMHRLLREEGWRTKLPERKSRKSK